MSMTNIDLSTAETVKRLFDKWAKPLGLLWWDIKLNLYDNPSDVIAVFRYEDDEVVAGKSTADWRYGTASVDINLIAVADMDEDEIERLIVHELLHVIVNEMREGDLRHEERVVTCLTKAMRWVAAGQFGALDADQAQEPGVTYPETKVEDHNGR